MFGPMVGMPYVIDEETPEQFAAPARIPNQLVRYEAPPEPCYLCAKPTDCVLVVGSDPGDRKLPPTRTYRLHVCNWCAWAWKLWTPPPQP